MNLRHIVVAVSTAAILAGSSYGALAGYHKKSYSKGESYSSVESKGYFDRWGNPVAKTEQHQHNTSFTNQSDGGAGADAGTTGGALAGSIGGNIEILHVIEIPIGPSVKAAAAWGSTDGSSCAGSGCAD